MTDTIDESAVAVSLMREALTLLDAKEAQEAAALLKRAIDAAENLPHHDDTIIEANPSQ
jgi:hypothetical protein